MKVSRVIISDDGGENLYLAIISLTPGTKDLRGVNMSSIVRDLPHISSAADRQWVVTCLRQPAGEKMGPG